MEKFGSIGQFRDVIKSVNMYCNKYGKDKPILEFTGTVKLHGTNAAVNVDKQNNILFQSRERVLALNDDNAGFCRWGMYNKDILMNTIKNVRENLDTSYFEKLVIYGEWCGPGIQNGVAINKLQNKIFVIFNITGINGEDRQELTPSEVNSLVVRSKDIYTAYDFKTFRVDIDFNAPQLIQNELVNLTVDVEDECPVGKHFNIIGIGEGIVWWNHELNLKFKVKGEKHSNSKVNTVKEIAAIDIERMANMDDFVDSVVTINRMEQGLVKLTEMGLDNTDVKNTGTFIKWVIGDVFKEENDIIVASNFDVRELNPLMSNKAKKFWFKHLDKQND